MSKPRELMLRPVRFNAEHEKISFTDFRAPGLYTDMDTDEHYYFIEKSAYDAMAEVADHNHALNQKLEAQADKLAQALEFYRDATIGEEQGDGGSLAEQALKEYRGEK